jgi:hypothetical protein
MVVRYSRGGRSGIVRVYYGTGSRASDSGFPAVKGWQKMGATGAGFPAIKGTVETHRPGYWGYLGWIQWLTQEYAGESSPDGKVDRLPSFQSLNSPFLSMGYAPSVFDSPAFSAQPPENFRARLFLCTLPIMSRREPISPLVGFTWGFRRRNQGEGHVRLPLEKATARDWKQVRAELVQRLPTWKYATAL